jgi:zinc-ribbon domain
LVDCPNCAEEVSEEAELCPHCGFHVTSQQAAEVRRLREEGLIHPGRIGAHPDARTERRPAPELPAEDRGRAGPEEIDAGL